MLVNGSLLGSGSHVRSILADPAGGCKVATAPALIVVLRSASGRQSMFGQRPVATVAWGSTRNAWQTRTSFGRRSYSTPSGGNTLKMAFGQTIEIAVGSWGCALVVMHIPLGRIPRNPAGLPGGSFGFWLLGGTPVPLEPAGLPGGSFGFELPAAHIHQPRHSRADVEGGTRDGSLKPNDPPGKPAGFRVRGRSGRSGKPNDPPGKPRDLCIRARAAPGYGETWPLANFTARKSASWEPTRRPFSAARVSERLRSRPTAPVASARTGGRRSRELRNSGRSCSQVLCSDSCDPISLGRRTASSFWRPTAQDRLG